MNILRKPIGKHIAIIMGALAVMLLASDPGVITRLFPSQRELTITGAIDPGLSLTLGTAYLARRDGPGCERWSLFGGWGRRSSGEQRVASVSNGRYRVSIPVPDRSAERCGYTFQGVSLGLSEIGTSPTRWEPLFAYSSKMSGTDMAVADPLEAYCTPVPGSRGEWVCSRRPDAPAVLGYDADRMPEAMTMNIHLQPAVPYDIVL